MHTVTNRLRFKVYFLIFRTDAILLGHYRLSQDTDNQTKVFAVITKKKEEVSMQGGFSSFLFISVPTHSQS